MEESNNDNSSFVSLENEASNLYKKDDYMKYYLVSDNIEPIALDEEVHILKKLEQHSFKLTEILESLEKKKEKEESDVFIPEYEKHEVIEDEEEIERINYGLYLHDVNIIDDSIYNSASNNIFDKNENPISIKGDIYIKNIVEFHDLSPYNTLSRVYKIEWFLGVDINDDKIHEITPIHQGKKFLIPFEALGKYIFCKAHRRIYKNDQFQEKEKNCVFDPHTLTTKPIKFKNNPEYVDMFSITSKGPALISIDMAFRILIYLCNNNYSIKVIIEDPLDNLSNLSSSEDDDMTNTTSTISLKEKNNNQLFIATLNINFDEVELTFFNDDNNDENSLQKKEFLFNFFKFWGFNYNSSSISKEENIDSLNDETVYKRNRKEESKQGRNHYANQFYKKNLIFNIYEVEFQLSNKEDFIIIAIGSNLQKSFRFVKYKMIRIKPFDKNISIYELWITLLSFKSAYIYKNIFKKYSKTIYKNGNITFVQNMLNNYLIKSTTKNINETLPFHKINTIFNEE